MGDSRVIDLKEMMGSQIRRLDSVLALKVEEALSPTKSPTSGKSAPAVDQVNDICKLAETMCRLINQTNTM